MAKKKKIAKVAPVAPPPPALQFGVFLDPSKPLESRKITKSTDGWSEYKLDDGTVLKLRGVLVDAKRAVDQFVMDGKPLYICQMAIVTETVSPKKLLRPKLASPKKAKKTPGK
jgi:hypothetical protein